MKSENRKWFVYIHKNKINGKVYIGITSCKNVNARWKNGKGYARSHFKNAIKKYGWDNFEHEILYVGLSAEMAKKIEIELIKEYRKNIGIDNVYNKTDGGDGFAGVKPMLGKKHSEETKRKISNGIKEYCEENGCITSRKVICKERIFNSAKDFSDFYNIPYNTAVSWLNHSNRLPEMWMNNGLRYIDESEESYFSYSNDRKDERARYKKPAICDGNIFVSVKKCSEYYGVNYNTMINWLIGNTPMPDIWKTMGLGYYDEDDNISYILKGKTKSQQKSNTRVNRSVPVICDGMKFLSITECSEYYNVPVYSVSRWLSGSRNMPKRFKDMELRYVEHE